MGKLPDFGTWYREQHPQVLAALTVASTSADIAAEATDEAFVRAYERWERVRQMDSPGGWLYRVAFNDMRRRHRRRAIERQLLARGRSPRDDIAPAPAALDPHVWAAVRTLPDRQRIAVALRYILDLTEADVAQVMRVTRGAASASLTAARKKLETLLADGPAIDGAAATHVGTRPKTPPGRRYGTATPPGTRSVAAGSGVDRG